MIFVKYLQSKTWNLYTFKILHKTRFYYLIDKMWEEKDNTDSKINSVYPTKASFVKPFLLTYGGDFDTFGNRTVLNSTRAVDKQFRLKVDAIFK